MRRIPGVFLLLIFLAQPVLPQAAELVGLRIIVVRSESEATSILAKLQAGEKFEELAKTNSTDSTAAKGGYLGTVVVSQLREEFQSALEGVKPGEVGRIAKVGREYALLQLLSEEDARAFEVKTLLESHGDVNAPFGDGSTFLMGAGQSGQIEIVRALIEAGASVNAKTSDGVTALIVAAQAGQAEVARMLLRAGASVNQQKKNGGTALIDAAFGGHLQTVNVLLQSGADPELTLEDGSTALMAASGKGHNDVVKALLAGHAQVNAGINTGGTALMEAAYAGQAETVRTLLTAGADPRPANPDGITALMGAALGGHTEAVQALLNAGAPVAPRDKRGWTALTYARASANTATVRAVLAASTNLSAQEKSIALGGTYMNEYYSSNEAGLLDSAAAEFQKVLNVQPQNIEALEWMGAVQFLRWSKPPTFAEFRKSESLLRMSAELDPKDPDRHCWITALVSIFASTAKADAAIIDEGIQHGKRAIELDPQFADAMDHLSVLYRLKGESALADSTHQDAVRARERLRNRPSRFNDQFSRPALPQPPI